MGSATIASSGDGASLPRSVAIIGAGLAGTVLALTLQKHGIKSCIYELRDQEYSVGGSLTIQPNGLRILDAIGVYERLRPQEFNSEIVTLHNFDTDTTVAEGSGLEAAYGYKSLRISRTILLHELRTAVRERGISIEYGFRFSHVVSETQDSVTFASVDGTTHSAELLVAADGIHSKVRRRVAAVEPEYTGMLGLGATVPRGALRFPKPEDSSQFRLPLNLRKGGVALNVLPQNADGSSVIVLKGLKLPERSREEWAELFADKDIRQGLEDWPDLVHSALEAIDPGTFVYWPVYQMPRLESWMSTRGRVLLLGDAAHAVSPITGQGANQAFEDAFMLGTVLGQVGGGTVSVDEALRFWHDQRKARVHGLIDRLLGKGAEGKDPIELRSKKTSNELADTGPRGDAWLYGVDLEAAVTLWANSRK